MLRDDRLEIYEEFHFDTFMTKPNIFLGKITLFHFSQYKCPIIKPITINPGNKLAKPRKSSWWCSNDYQCGWVLMCALFKKWKECKWKDVTWTIEEINGTNGKIKTPIGIIGETFFNKHKSFIENFVCYKHIKTFNGKDLGRGCEYSVEEYTCDIDVIPDKIVKLGWKHIQDYVKIVPDEDLEIYNKVIREMKANNKHLQDLVHERKPWVYYDFDKSQKIKEKYKNKENGTI